MNFTDRTLCHNIVDKADFWKTLGNLELYTITRSRSNSPPRLTAHISKHHSFYDADSSAFFGLVLSRYGN